MVANHKHFPSYQRKYYRKRCRFSRGSWYSVSLLDTDTIVPQAERCEGTTNLSPFTDDVVVAWNFLILNSGKSSCTIHENCKLVSEAGTAAITVYVDSNESMDFSCREIAMLVKERVKQCHPNFDTRERTGGKVYITPAGKSFVVITPHGQSVC